MSFMECIKNQKSILMEGALGECLKRDFDLILDENIFMATLVYSEEGRNALYKLWSEYAGIAAMYHLPFCVHPNIVYEALMQPFNRNEIVNTKLIGTQANTSPLSFSELDRSNDLNSSKTEINWK